MGRGAFIVNVGPPDRGLVVATASPAARGVIALPWSSRDRLAAALRFVAHADPSIASAAPRTPIDSIQGMYRDSIPASYLSSPLARHRQPLEREQTSHAAVRPAVPDTITSGASPTPTRPLERPEREQYRPGSREGRVVRCGRGERGSRMDRDGAYTTTKPNPRRCQPVEDPPEAALRRFA